MNIKNLNGSNFEIEECVIDLNQSVKNFYKVYINMDDNTLIKLAPGVVLAFINVSRAATSPYYRFAAYVDGAMSYINITGSHTVREAVGRFNETRRQGELFK